MNCFRPSRRLATKALVACVFAVSTAFYSQAAPNLTDLSAFHGRYKGSAKVAVGTNSFRGSSKIRVSLKSATSIKVIIKASVKSGSSSVPVDNQLVFSSAGTLKGKELAPGVTQGSKFKGHYTVAGNKITFDGKFKVGSTTGTYNGTITHSNSGRLKLTYSIFVGENTDASYVYTYVGK